MEPMELFNGFIQQMVDLYDVLTVSDDYKRKIKEEHEQFGAFRSGEGTEAEIFEKIHKLEERKKLEKMLKNKEWSTDPVVNKKLYDLFLQHFKKNLVRNDEVDLVPHHKLEITPTS